MAYPGRPSKYNDLMNVKARKYLERVRQDKEDVPLIEDLAMELDVDEGTIINWAFAKTKKTGKLKNVEFFRTYREIKNLYKSRLKKKGLTGEWNSNVVKLLLSADHKVNETNNQKITQKSENLNKNVNLESKIDLKSLKDDELENLDKLLSKIAIEENDTEESQQEADDLFEDED